MARKSYAGNGVKVARGSNGAQHLHPVASAAAGARGGRGMNGGPRGVRAVLASTKSALSYMANRNARKPFRGTDTPSPVVKVPFGTPRNATEATE